ncbi:MAG: hypothetical protein VX278_20715, partial [Myxococcota bacterium]|nr:hypothetical protein [Myxococcota bacterium]
WMGDCTAWTDCVPGEFVAFPGTDSTDRYCLPCLEGIHFSDINNAPECTAITECVAGEYIETAATSASDQICTTCTDGMNFSDTSNAPECATLTECVPGEYVLSEATVTNNRICAPCIEGSTFSDTSNAPECSVVAECAPGSYVTAAPTTTSDRECDACFADLNFSTLPNASSCTPLIDCLAGEYVLSAPTTITNRICAPCTEGANFSSTNNAQECTAITECVPGEYILSQATATEDRICSPCIEGSNFSNTSNASSCTTVTECVPGQFVETAATRISDQSCASCTEGLTYTDRSNAIACLTIQDCIAGEYVTADPTLSSDRQCEICTPETWNDERNSQGCHDWTSCVAGEFVSLFGSTTSDRECEACTENVDFSLSDNVESCTEVQDCPAGTYILSEPSVISDRECETCVLDENFSDTINAEACEALTDCADNEYEKTAPTTSQNRECETQFASLVVVDGEAFEGGQDTAQMQISLSEAPQADVSVFFRTSGSAQHGDDYLLTVDGVEVTSFVTIPAGQNSVEVFVEPIVTPNLEVMESIFLTLVDDTKYELTEEATGEISIFEYGPSNGNTYYVDENGDDSNTGEESAPFATIGYAVDQLSAGDTLYIKDGTYTNDDYVSSHGSNGTQNISNPLLAKISVSGTEDNWIKIAAYPDGNDVRPLLKFDGSGGIEIKQGEKYIIIDGLEIEGANKEIQFDWAHHHRWSKENFYKGRGIYTWGPVDHIVVRNCNVHHTPGSGIRFNKADYIMVEDNIVSNTTWWSSSAESAIVIATAESIDTEDAVKHLYSGNVVYNNWNFLEFCSTPLRYSTDDEYGNCDYYTGGIIDGQGLYVTRNNNTYTHGRMRFENNIAFNNGFGGVVYHKTDRGELINNLVFMNGAYPGLSNYTGLTVNTADDLIIRNNIMWARESDDYAMKNNGNASNVVATHNYVVGKTQFGDASENTIIHFSDAEDLGTFFENVVDISDAHPDPAATVGDYAPANIDALIQSYALDFYPLETADAILNTGTANDAANVDSNKTPRPQGSGIDIGPYEYVE